MFNIDAKANVRTKINLKGGFRYKKPKEIAEVEAQIEIFKQCGERWLGIKMKGNKPIKTEIMKNNINL